MRGSRPALHKTQPPRRARPSGSSRAPGALLPDLRVPRSHPPLCPSPHGTREDTDTSEAPGPRQARAGGSAQDSRGSLALHGLTLGCPLPPSPQAPGGQGWCQHFLTAHSPGLTGWEDWARPAQHWHEVSTPGSAGMGPRLRRPRRPEYRAAARCTLLPPSHGLFLPEKAKPRLPRILYRDQSTRDRRAVCPQPEGPTSPLARNPRCRASVCRSSGCLNASSDGALTTLKAAARLQAPGIWGGRHVAGRAWLRPGENLSLGPSWAAGWGPGVCPRTCLGPLCCFCEMGI